MSGETPNFQEILSWSVEDIKTHIETLLSKKGCRLEFDHARLWHATIFKDDVEIWSDAQLDAKLCLFSAYGWALQHFTSARSSWGVTPVAQRLTADMLRRQYETRMQRRIFPPDLDPSSLDPEAIREQAHESRKKPV